MSQGQGGGRPLKFKSVKKLQEAIDAYFAECDPHMVEKEFWEYPLLDDDDLEIELEDQPHGGSLKRSRRPRYGDEQVQVFRKVLTAQVPYTTTGLAMALDTSRKVLLDYGEGKYDTIDEKFSYTVKKAKDKVEQYAELYLFNGKNTAGAIFNLKNNHAWKDRSEVDETSQVTVITRKHQDAEDSPDDDEEPDDDDD